MTIPLFIGGIGGPEIALIFLLVVLLFGADKLPKLARSSGEAMGEFQKGREEIETELNAAKERATAATTPASESDASDTTAELVDDDEAVADDATDTSATPA